jgi:hypothetical protein
MMKYFDWNSDKNEQLKKERHISFEIIVAQIEADKISDIVKHPNKEKYPGQKIFIVEYEHYAYLVPFVEEEEKIFLKTIIPIHKATKKYLPESEK